VLIVGNYGSGKTEVAVNLAVNRLKYGPVQVVDLDVVNPYFRSREVRSILEAKGVEVIVPEERLIEADLPVVVPQIRGAILKPKGLAILDVGGDNVGATVLGSLNDELVSRPHDVLQVVNVKRPFTETVEGCVAITREIEAACRLKVTGVIGNAHLMDETDEKTILDGYKHARGVAEALGVPLKFITCEERVLATLDRAAIRCPILPLSRQMLPPWRRRQALGSQNFLLS